MKAIKEKSRIRRNDSVETEANHSFNRFRNTSQSKEAKPILKPENPNEPKTHRKYLNRSYDSTVGNMKDLVVVTNENQTARRCKYIPDNIMFNDSYVDDHQVDLHRKKVFAKTNVIIPFKFANENNSSQAYCPKNTASFNRKIQDFHGNDILKPVNKSGAIEEKKEMKPASYKNANAKKKLASTNIKKTFTYNKKDTESIPVDKISSYPVEMLKITASNKKKEPNFAKTAFCTNEISLARVPPHAFGKDPNKNQNSFKTNVLCPNEPPVPTQPAVVNQKPKGKNNINSAMQKNTKGKSSGTNGIF